MSTQRFWKMTSGKIMEGVFAINKPTGISSAQALRDLQRHFNPSALFAPYLAHEKSLREREAPNQKRRRRNKGKPEVKIGHGGTLDPLATGVLIAGVGKGTKSLLDFLLCTKVYECVVLFGTTTDTYDRVGKVISRAPTEHITRELVEEKMAAFRGKFKQLPPLFSALKMDGKPLYEYAREGKPIPRQIERRDVDVLELEMLEWYPPGEHGHQAPSEEAGYMEVNLARSVWSQEGVAPGKRTGTESEQRELFERRKRKMNDDQDELVKERPASKAQRGSPEEEDPTMSGGLPVKEEADLVKTTIETSLTPSAAPAVEDINEETKRDPALPTPLGPPAAKLRMVVTSGFYVRSLCHDLGSAVGSGAIMAELERTRQGEFEVGKNVLEYSDLEKGEEVWAPLVEGWLDEWYKKDKRFGEAGLGRKQVSSGEVKSDKNEVKKETSPAAKQAVDS